MHDRHNRQVTSDKPAWTAPRLLRLEAGSAELHLKAAIPEGGSGS